MSCALHVGIIAVAIWVGLFFVPANFGGSGSGIVEVMISGPAEETIGNVSKAPKIPKGRIERNGDDAAQNAGRTGGSQAEGSGVGAGEGSGVGSGKNGDTRLKEIWKKINRAKYYPQMAKKQGIEGTPRVTFFINAGGNVEWANIATSSGDEILDKAAIEAVKNAAPLPQYPQPITLTLRYSLSDK